MTTSADTAAIEPAKLAQDLEDEQICLASCRDMCSEDDELPRWDRLQRAINYLRALSAGIEHSAIYISKRLTGSDADASFVQAHINQAVSEAMDRSTAPPANAPVAISDEEILAVWRKFAETGLCSDVLGLSRALLAASMGGDKS